MKIEIKIPAMGESISQAVIGEIFKKTGTIVAQDEEILELETDKVNQPLYAPKSGEITLTVKTGDTVSIGTVIGTVDTSKAAKEPPKEEAKEKAPPQAEITPPAPKEEKVPEKKEPVPQYDAPLRHFKEDFLQETAKSAPPQPQKAPAPTEKVTRKPMSKIRRVIAKRLLEVKQETAMLTTFNEVDMTAVSQIREKHKDAFLKKTGVKLGFMSFFAKAAAKALRAFPEVNASIDGTDILYRNTIDISIAVSTEKGLIVPVVRNVDQLSFAEVEQAIALLAKKARDSTLTIEDLQGGGFTITNGGVFGSLLSTPILNPPQSAILGMHTIQKRPVVIDDAIVIRPMMYLALSYDHRLIDGKEAVSFLVAIKAALEDPSLLLIDL
ncbi:2-oxoglutarate dehydrogenase complex dihydrolipoyllysine-residue succinyltransferase [Estrella lausannensis]|uniref:Dihydrolipoyllysine-residue succinyltransferase n=1 Tax=Estrella lausannensis TaxID=483423 RepID=A0A0H5DSG9_9BACT|nr:2-oxoglutarate dehydrogenase complex dihydrolipoyllysine-residue succinyltransferase [Estrella lausannensis]CRX39243.1 2-oxogluturate dehydrogenase complex E2 component [Estrella lausannensis]